MKLRLLPLSFLSILAALPASAKPPKIVAGGATACGMKTMPLATGNTWTYKTGSQSVILKVTNVAQGKDWSDKPATIVDVDETFNGKTTKTKWSCTAAGGLYIPIESFLWSGEPGGPVGSTYTVKSHDKPWLVSDAELTGDVAWIEIVKADVTRPDAGGAGVQHRPAVLEVERHAQLKGNENLATAVGQLPAERISFELRGRAQVDDQKSEVPIKRPAMVWISKGVGVVKIDDAFDKTWELTETNLIQPAAPGK